MVIINVDKIRQNYTAEKIIKLITENQKYFIYPDQDFLNKIFKDEIKIIDSKYNTLVKEINYKDLPEKPLIIHFAGHIKPWNNDVSVFEKEYLEPFYEAMRLQGDYKKEKLKKLICEHEKHGYKI